MLCSGDLTWQVIVSNPTFVGGKELFFILFQRSSLNQVDWQVPNENLWSNLTDDSKRGKVIGEQFHSLICIYRPIFLYYFTLLSTHHCHTRVCFVRVFVSTCKHVCLSDGKNWKQTIAALESCQNFNDGNHYNGSTAIEYCKPQTCQKPIWFHRMLKDVSQNFGSVHKTKTSKMNSSIRGVLIKACLSKKKSEGLCKTFMGNIT